MMIQIAGQEVGYVDAVPLRLRLLISLLSVQVNQEDQRVTIAFTHVAVIDTNQASVQQDMTVVIVGNRIVDVGKVQGSEPALPCFLLLLSGACTEQSSLNHCSKGRVLRS